MTDEEYNGWTNRETWAFNLWVENERAIYAWRNAAVDAAIAEHGDLHPYYAEQIGKQFWEAQMVRALRATNFEHRREALTCIEDIGSFWRVDWREIAEHWKQDADDRK